MQPIKITIPGRYWDSFIYKGRLYLFGLDGDIRSVSWESLIANCLVPDDTKVAFICAFERSDYLYQSDVQVLLRDPEIQEVVRKKFNRLSKLDLQISENFLRVHEKGRQDNPCPFPHADLDIYKDRLYVGSSSGLSHTSCNRKTKYPVGTRPKKKWDGPVLGISASYDTIAMAAGSEGLFELNLNKYSYSGESDVKNLSGIACRNCGWAYYSVFASSDNSGYMAEFRKETNNDFEFGFDGGHGYTRSFEKLDTAFDIFGSEGYSWGTQDKLCQASAQEIKVVKYEPWNSNPELRIKKLGSVALEPWKGEVVSAATANFGVVVELENAIVVLPSAGKPVTLPGEPVNWRIFTRSRRYENQLHVIYDDHLEVLSFNQDYLVTQDAKLLGTSVFTSKGRMDNFSEFTSLL
jgi:hypothetical protein